MHSRVLRVGIISLLTVGLFLSSCSQQEVAPAPSPAEPSTGETVIPVPTTEELRSTPTLAAPPMPAWLHREQGILFQEDFEDGSAEGFFLEGAAYIEREGGTKVMSLSGTKKRAVANVYIHSWTDYVADVQFKVNAGILKFFFRVGHGAGTYLLHIEPTGLELLKNIGQDIFNLGRWQGEVPLNRWHALEVALQGTDIKIYLDGDMKCHYVDEELPVRTGGLSFAAEEGSQALIDDIVVTGINIVQEAKWVKTGGPSGGLGYDIRIHPQDKDIMFVTDNPSGVNKSYDGGKTWVAKNKGITARAGSSEDGIPIFCLTIDRNNPDIVWVGTQYMRGIFKSTDGGETWVKRDRGVSEWDEITLRGFDVAPGNSDIVLTAAEIDTGKRGWMGLQVVTGKIYRSENGGENWHEANRGLENADKNITAIAVHPTNLNIAYAATFHDGIFKTIDGGESWMAINNGLFSLDVRSLAIDPKNTDTVYAGLGEGAGIFKTTNGGELWEGVNYGIQVECPSYLQRVGQVRPGVSLVKPARLSGVDYYSLPWTNIRSIVIDPTNTKTVYAADSYLGVYVSVDGGASWHPVNDGLSTRAVATLSISADGKVLYAATSGEGVFKLELW